MRAGTYALVVAIGTAGCATAVVIASARRSSPISAVHLLRAAVLAVALLAVAGGGGLYARRLDFFGLMHVAFLDAVVAVPLAAALVLLTVAVTRSRWSLSLSTTTGVALGFALLLAPLGFYMTRVEPYWLETEQVGGIALAEGRTGAEAIRVGVLADLQTDHIGDHETGAVDRLLAERPDLILLPGDIFQGDDATFRRELPAFRALFDRLQAPGGAFLVVGDTDPVERLRLLAEGTPVRFVHDEIVRTRVRDRDVTIAGISLEYQSAASTAVAHELETAPGDGDVRILLSHRPDAVYHLPADHPRTDLVVAGHTHGGQVSIPFFGPLVTLTGVPRSVAAGGLHEMAARRIYVGRGVGLERGQAPQIRLFVRPNVGILTVG